MASRIRLTVASVALAGLLCSGGATARQLGDFGRVEPGVVNDTILPALDTIGKVLTGQPRSDFNWTDQEHEMHDRVWRFLVAPHARDWAFEYGWEIKRARTGDRRPRQFGRYYRWLSDHPYASSRVRFNTIGDHVFADLGTLTKVFSAICAVFEIDRRRAVAASEMTDIEPRMVREQRDREAENLAYVDRFVLSLSYRYASYSFALDHLLVETPHIEALEVDSRLSELAIWVDRAEAGDFCSDGWQRGGESNVPIRARVLLNAPNEGEYLK